MYPLIPKTEAYHLPILRDTIFSNKGYGRDDSMSIALCFRGTNGLLLATDSVMTIVARDQKSLHTENTSQKLWRIANNMGLTSIGTQEDYRKYVIGKVIEFYKESEHADIEKVIEIIKTDYLGRIEGFSEAAIRRINYAMLMIIAGYEDSEPYIINVESDPMEGIAFSPGKRLYLPLGKRLYRCVQGMDTIAYYWITRLNLDKKLEEGISIESLKKIATFIILESSFTAGIGEPIQMATITIEDGCQLIGKDEINNLVKMTKRNSSLPKLNRYLFG